jgi:hypothetical protein
VLLSRGLTRQPLPDSKPTGLRPLPVHNDEYSLLPPRYFVEHWWSWVAVERWPERAARLHECERVVAESEDPAERRAAAAEIGQILRQAETATV